MKEAMERYGVSSGSLNSALTYGYSAGGYHFYRADEPKRPPIPMEFQTIPSTMSSMMTISPFFLPRKTCKPERKETI